MKEFNNMNDILDFAISREQSAVDFYLHLSSIVKNDEMKEVFLQFAKEEMGHKALLLKVMEEGQFSKTEIKINDIKLADYIIPEEKDLQNLTYPQALVLAMLREKSAYELYKKLSTLTTNNHYKELFDNLSDQELKHKSRFEIEYDNLTLRDN